MNNIKYELTKCLALNSIKNDKRYIKVMKQQLNESIQKVINDHTLDNLKGDDSKIFSVVLFLTGTVYVDIKDSQSNQSGGVTLILEPREIS